MSEDRLHPARRRASCGSWRQVLCGAIRRCPHGARKTGAPTQLPRRPQGCVTHIYKYTQTIIYNYLYSGPAPGGGAARPRGRAHSAQWQCVCHSPTVRARAPKLIYGRGRGGLH